MGQTFLHVSRPTALLALLIEAPDLVRRVRALPSQEFTALVREVGVETAGEIVAVATTEQIVAAFDEDLFVNAGPGERERFDPGRFVVWLEVLLEAGDEVAARRVADLSEDFVVQALSSLVLVLDQDALLARLGEGGWSAHAADKAIESALCEELDGYMLIAKAHEGWDAVLTLIVALDQNHRATLERILDRCAGIATRYVEDLDALTTVLTAEESLAEDVEAEREDRRAKIGYVEPRAARSFLALARRSSLDEVAYGPRDPITRAYFREVGRSVEPQHRGGPVAPPHAAGPDTPWRHSLVDILQEAGAAMPALPPAPQRAHLHVDTAVPIMAVLRELSNKEPERFAERLAELAYLANVLVVGADLDDGRMRPSEAIDAVVATVALGAELLANEGRPRDGIARGRATLADLRNILCVSTADRLFRIASGRLVRLGTPATSTGFLRSSEDLARVLDLCLGGVGPDTRESG